MPKESEQVYEQRCREALQNGNISEFKLQFSRWLYWYKITEKNKPYYGVYKFFEGAHDECVQNTDSPNIPQELRIYAVLSYITMDKYDKAVEALDDMRKRFEDDPKMIVMLDVIEAVVHFLSGKSEEERMDLLDAITHDKAYAIDYLHSVLSSIEDPKTQAILRDNFRSIIPEI